MTTTAWQILIVEDDDDNFEVIREALRYYQPAVQITHARSGVECLDALDRFTPTLVIMDLELPGLDGWRLLQALRHDPQTAAIPVVATTAYHSNKVAHDVHQAGFDGYFPKPIDVPTFGESLGKIIEGG